VAGSYRLVIVVVIAAVVTAVMMAAVGMMALSTGRLESLATLLATMETMPTASERHTSERHRQRQHQRREQYRNSLSHCYSPPFFLSKTP
jgi:ABC-type transport system involved in cytochrome bd biosynthesis fused ATPase/permease subunit